MKKVMGLILMTVSLGIQAQTKELTVQVIDSKIVWTGTKVTGYHQGTIKIKEGKIQLKNQKLAGGSFTIDMTSIKNTDIPDSDPVPKRKLEDHLKSADFFDVKSFPTAQFEIKEVRSHPSNPSRYIATGDLTIKGITKGIKIEIIPSTETDKLFIAQADIRFDRQLWGVAYKGLADQLVHDEVRLNVIIKAR